LPRSHAPRPHVGGGLHRRDRLSGARRGVHGEHDRQHGAARAAREPGAGSGGAQGAHRARRGRGGGPRAGPRRPARGGVQGGWRWPAAVNWALALEAAMLVVFAMTWHASGDARTASEGRVLIAVLAAAMGIQSAAVRRLDVPGIATTYMTGTLTSAVTGLVAGRRPSRAPAGVPPPRWERGVALQLVSLVVYGIGAMAGGLLQSRGRTVVAVAPLLVVLAVVAASSRRAHRMA